MAVVISVFKGFLKQPGQRRAIELQKVELSAPTEVGSGLALVFGLSTNRRRFHLAKH